MSHAKDISAEVQSRHTDAEAAVVSAGLVTHRMQIARPQEGWEVWLGR